MRRLLCLAAAVFALGISALAAEQSAPLTAVQIMERVAANQDRTEAARTRYVYQQHIKIASRKPGGRLMCEEVTDSRVSPLTDSSHQQFLKLDGKLWRKGRYLEYSELPKEEKGDSDVNVGIDDNGVMDRDLVENLRKNLADDKSKDGLGRGLFPLTSKQQSQYLFKLLGQQTMNGRNVYRVRFRPKDKNDFDWKGEAYIDREEFQPVVVYTQMSRKVPLAVRTLLGTNVPGLGFSVTYARQADGVWFPVSFGTEFRMRVLFFIARDISMSLGNTQFEKTHTDMRILEGATPVADAGGAATPAADH
jgi:hypothetical protein